LKASIRWVQYCLGDEAKIFQTETPVYADASPSHFYSIESKELIAVKEFVGNVRF